MIRITSEGYDKEVVVDINDLASVPKAQGTVSLVAGMVEAIQKFGFKVAGFDAYVTTNVIRAAGVSSSASFEMLVCSIINYFFNDGASHVQVCIPFVTYVIGDSFAAILGHISLNSSLDTAP